MRQLGIDIGSVYLGVAMVEDGHLTARRYLEHHGDWRPPLASILADAEFSRFSTCGVTGHSLDPMLAIVEGARYLYPGCRNVLSVGGQTFALILLDEQGRYVEHTTNPPCASGTGSFIEQQAERLGLSVPELAERASGYEGKTPRIATRCAVFAKTDIIHAMQEGYSTDAVCAGLCDGIAGNVLDALIKGREISDPVGMVGGVSLNPRLTDALERLLGRSIHVADGAHLCGAIGAARLGVHEDPHSLTRELESPQREERKPLAGVRGSYPDFGAFDITTSGDVEMFLPPAPASPEEGVTIGIDIGSTSTKCVVLAAGGDIVGGWYTRTGGEPIQAVSKLVHAMNRHFGGNTPPILGVGTTGSGRKMIKHLFHADMEINEITAHATAAAHLHPEVDTIIEIGGQDSKFTRISGGDVWFSTMNYVCAAGTGSFIEEQARRLGVDLRQFSDMALGTAAPYTSDRCTVYMERDLTALLNEGWSRESLAAAVLHSVRDNYMAKVVARNPVGEHIVFQGATARNPALVACFEELLQQPVHVSPYCHLTGALGVALLCRQAEQRASSFTWKVDEVDVRTEVCDRCANKCMLTVAESDGQTVGWGMKCGREYEERRAAVVKRSSVERRYREAFAPMRTATTDSMAPSPANRKRISIAVPEALSNLTYGPLWQKLLSDLGFTVTVWGERREALEAGRGIVNADFCAPMIQAHGYVRLAHDSDADFVFLPAIENERQPGTNQQMQLSARTADGYYCYYSQYLPTIIATLTSLDMGQRLLSPLISFGRMDEDAVVAALHESLRSADPSLTVDEVAEAFLPASRLHQVCRRSLRLDRGPSGAGPRVLLIGRPYVVLDPALNLSIPNRFDELGAELYWQEEIDTTGFEPVYARKYLDRMHWHFGHRILELAEYAAQSEDLYIVFMTSFRCSPDAFLLSYVKDIMSHYSRPYLVLQLDELSSDVGYTTRIEAALHTFATHYEAPPPVPATTTQHFPDPRIGEGDTILLFHLDEVITALWTACFERAGYRTVVLEDDARALSTGYRYCSGGECVPLVSIMGGAINAIRDRGIDPARTFYYLPTVCMACNFPQYPILSNEVFRAAGLEGVKVGLVNTMSPGDVLEQSLAARLFEAEIVGGLLHKVHHRIQPYECRTGAADECLEWSTDLLRKTIMEGTTDLRTALSTAADAFRAIERDESGGRKPRVAILGDVYVKYNDAVNRNIRSLVQNLGGELVVSSMTEYPFHLYDADIRIHKDDPRRFRLLRRVEQRFERLVSDIIPDLLEPDFDECTRLLEEYGITHYLPGETTINVGRALYYAQTGTADAILHLNPMFCCPGVVTASIFRKIQRDFDLPVVDIFYDGTGDPNSVIIPHLHYLRTATAPRGEE